MATVFMKWLEQNPRMYDRGIRLLTLGQLTRVHDLIAERYAQPGSRVLEIGCGTGALTYTLASRGAKVSAIDASQKMLQVAEEKIHRGELHPLVDFHHLDATQIGDHFPPASFDLILASLVFSELTPEARAYILEASKTLLSPDGRLVILDEVLPPAGWRRMLYRLVRAPLAALTWLLTRTTTHTLEDFAAQLEANGYHISTSQTWLGGSLALFEGLPAEKLEEKAAPPPEPAQPAPLSTDLPPQVIARLQPKRSLKTLLLDLWGLFLRIMPPYPKVKPGLYAVGQPDTHSPVLVTGNFELTVRRLVKAIHGQVDAWLLVADSAGINVWCAAGGGYFTAEKVISILKTSRVEQVVEHHALILPQLCANGVDGWVIRQETGWGVHWGPVRAADLPAYLAAGRKKSDAMRWVRFPLKDRLEMVTVTLGFYALMILIPVAIFWRQLFFPVAVSLVGLSYFYAVVHPWLPGKDGLYKSIPLTAIALLGLLAYTALVDPLPPPRLFNWAVGLTGLSVFTGAELQGMSPLMRGEQANWSYEAMIAVGLGLIYWLVPLALGWR